VRSTQPRVIETIGILHHRIFERFPGAGLASVCELRTLANDSSSGRKASQGAMCRCAAILLLVAAGDGGLVWIAQLMLGYVSATAVPGRLRRRVGY
jgi:hypothetical protein